MLHERRSGWADASATIRELAREARDAGVTILEGVEVVGMDDRGREHGRDEPRLDPLRLRCAGLRGVGA